jgi:hypothetical protein
MKTEKNNKYLFILGPIVAVVLCALFISIRYSSNTTGINKTVPIVSVSPGPNVYQFDTKLNTSWQEYKNSEGFFAISYPPNWQVSDVKPNYVDEKYDNSVEIEGAEGKITIHWTNDGYGGGCPHENQKVISVNDKLFSLCHYSDDDGTEYYGQLSNQNKLTETSWIWTYVDAIVKKPNIENREITLTALTSITFDKASNIPSPTSDKTYKDPTGTYSITYPDKFVANLYDYAWDKYLILSYSKTDETPLTNIGTDSSVSVDIRLLSQSGTGELDKTVKQITDEAHSDESKAPAFNDEVSAVSEITMSNKNGYTFTTRKGNQVSEEIYLDLGKVVEIKRGKSKTLWISIQYRGQSDYVERSKLLVKEMLNTLEIK